MITLSTHKTTISGRKATTYSDDFGTIGAYIFIDDNDKGEKMFINIDFDHAFQITYNTIENTLIIMQNPNE